MPTILDRDAVLDTFRNRVLAVLDEVAVEVFEAAGYDLPKTKAATDDELPKLFAAIDAQVDRLVERLSDSTVVETFEKVDIKLAPFDGYHAFAGAGADFGFCDDIADIRQEIRDHWAEADGEREVPLDTPALDTSFHDHEMNVGDEPRATRGTFPKSHRAEGRNFID